MKINFWSLSVLKWPFYDLCYCEHLTVRFTSGRYYVRLGYSIFHISYNSFSEIFVSFDNYLQPIYPFYFLFLCFRWFSLMLKPFGVSGWSVFGGILSICLCVFLLLLWYCSMHFFILSMIVNFVSLLKPWLFEQRCCSISISLS